MKSFFILILVFIFFSSVVISDAVANRSPAGEKGGVVKGGVVKDGGKGGEKGKKK